MNAEFEEQVLTIIGAIPTGKVVTYGQIAKMSGYASHARMVGRILKSLPKDSTLPWYRVINSQGRISFPEGSDKFNEQKMRLESEHVVIKNNRIELRKFQW
jgi:methylated-DNA-protein-cysteine methyltransferase-like protein